jgi:hypothetical protein
MFRNRDYVRAGRREPGIHAGRISLAMAHWLRFEGGMVLAQRRFASGRGPQAHVPGGEAQWVFQSSPSACGLAHSGQPATHRSAKDAMAG